MPAPKRIADAYGDPRRYIMQCGNFVYSEQLRRYFTRKVADVQILGGVWPSDTALMTIVDGDDPAGPPSHFGGKVEIVSLTERRVTVYLD